MSREDDEVANIWITDEAVAKRYGYGPGMVPVPFSHHERLFASGDAQDPRVGAMHLVEIGQKIPKPKQLPTELPKAEQPIADTDPKPAPKGRGLSGRYQTTDLKPPKR